MSKCLGLITLLILTGCHPSPQYQVSQCTYCKFEDEPNKLPKIIYQVIAMDSSAKTYTIKPLSSPIPGSDVLMAPEIVPFDYLDDSKPQGRAPKCSMTRIDCPPAK